MKKMLVFLFFLVAFCACNHAAYDAVSRQNEEVREEVRLNDGHTAQNSLDYFGVYTADSEGSPVREVELASGNRYRLVTSTGEQKIGEYRWDGSGRILTLIGSATPDFWFFVGENVLWLNSDTPHQGIRFPKETF